MHTKNNFYLFLLLFIGACSIKKESVPGLYISRNTINTIDSLYILEDGHYINLIYRKRNNSLVYRNTGKWEVQDGYITFDDFYVDEDDDYSNEVSGFEETLITCEFPLEKKSDTIIIHHKAMYDDMYLEKIK